MYHKILEQLHSFEEEEYRVFSSRLLPNISNVRGIRLPILQKIAKEISKEDVFRYFKEVKHSFFEETLLMGFVIGNMNLKHHSIEVILSVIRGFVPYINNWSTCDSFCSSLKIAKKEPERVYEFLQAYTVKEEETLESLNRDKREYELRFFIVMCLNYYIKDPYIEQVLIEFRKIRSSRYYVNMALAWAYSKIFLEYPDKVIAMLEEERQNRKELSKDDIIVHNKTISKICDSYKVSMEDKRKLRTFLIN